MGRLILEIIENKGFSMIVSLEIFIKCDNTSHAIEIADYIKDKFE